MKTIITLLTTAMLAVGATGAIAAEQGSDEASGFALGLQTAGDLGGVHARGAYASAHETRQTHNNASNVPATQDFQLDGR